MSGGNNKKRRTPQKDERKEFRRKLASAVVQATLNLFVYVLDWWVTGGHRL